MANTTFPTKRKTIPAPEDPVLQSRQVKTGSADKTPFLAIDHLDRRRAMAKTCSAAVGFGQVRSPHDHRVPCGGVPEGGAQGRLHFVAENARLKRGIDRAEIERDMARVLRGAAIRARLRI